MLKNVKKKCSKNLDAMFQLTYLCEEFKKSINR